MFLVAALLAIQAPKPTPAPPTYVTFVGMAQGRCVYQTGDVLMSEDQFEADLRDRFESSANMIIYHAPNVPDPCLATARRIARRIHFRTVRVEVAPPNLDMGPP